VKPQKDLLIFEIITRDKKKTIMPDYYFIAQLGDPTLEDWRYMTYFVIYHRQTNITKIKGMTEIP